MAKKNRNGRKNAQRTLRSPPSARFVPVSAKDIPAFGTQPNLYYAPHGRVRNLRNRFLTRGMAQTSVTAGLKTGVASRLLIKIPESRTRQIGNPLRPKY